MRIAVVYRGLYIRGNKNFSFLESYENHVNRLLNFLPDCDLFFSTTPSHYFSKDQELLNLLKWKKTHFTNSNTCVLDSILSSLNFHNFSEYDFIFNLRFDLKFNKPIDLFSINYDKFNFLWLEPYNFNQNGNIRVSDLIYGFPTKYLENFKNINLEDETVRYSDNSLIGTPDQAHHLLQFLKLNLNDEVNFMIPGEHMSGGQQKDDVAESFIELDRGQ